MKRFAFRLETLLKYRKNLEEKERAQLFQIIARLRREQNHLENLQKKHQEVLVDLAEQRSAGTDFADASWFYAYLDRLRLEMRKSAERICRLEQDLEDQKAVLIEASKRKKILDSLKTRQRKTHQANAEKLEQKSVDDLVVVRYPRKSG